MALRTCGLFVDGDQFLFSWIWFNHVTGSILVFGIGAMYLGII
jgi:hypothetical protein